MQNIITKNISFKLTKRGSEKGIEIFFEQGEVFWSCKRGTDLFDFDALLEHFIPNIDFESITRPIARWWEQELFRLLSRCKKQCAIKKSFLNFCQRISKRYCQKPGFSLSNKQLVTDLITQLNKSIAEKMGLINIVPEFSWKKSRILALARVSA